MRRLFLLILIVSLALAACGDDSPAADDTTESGSNMGLFDWERDAETIVARLDTLPDQEKAAFITNSIPPCTLWGDGRVVWTTNDDSGAEVVLEARIDEVAMRGFLEDIINRGFYDWEDEMIPPSTIDPVIESITVSLYDEVRTIRRYSNWPQNSFERVLENCRALSDQPVLVQPAAGWISAYPVPRDTMAPSWPWPANAPFSLRELTENGESRWLEGSLATEVWLSARQNRGDIQVIERNDAAYEVAIAVPGYSRDAAPPPEDASP